jgi:DNA-binding IclR family transcriptional regulator
MARSSTSAERRPAPRGRPRRTQVVAAPARAQAAPRGDGLFVGSVAKCFQVLEALNAAARPVTLTELAPLADLPRSAVQRLTHTLRALGYLRQHPVTRAYTLGSRMLEFGHTVLATDRVRERALPHLAALNRDTGETVNLMVLEGRDIVYVARFPSVHAVSVDLHVGSRLPAFCTAAGRAILAELDPARARTMLAAAPRRALTPRTVTDVAGLMDLLAHARRVGYALNDQEAVVGDISVAAALRTPGGEVTGAINIAVPTPRWKVDDVRRSLAPRVMATARAVTDDLADLPEA